MSGGGGGGGEGGEGADEAGGEWAGAFEDVAADGGGRLVGGEHHFEFGVDVIDVMEDDGFRGFGEDWGAVLVFAVMGADEVEEVEADLFGGGGEVLPWGVGGGVGELTPEPIDEFDAEGDVAEEFAGFGVGHVEAVGGEAVFPELAAVVEEDSCDDEVAVELGVGGADGGGGAHHLGDVFDETAAAGVMVFAGGSGAAEAFAEFG